MLKNESRILACALAVLMTAGSLLTACEYVPESPQGAIDELISALNAEPAVYADFVAKAPTQGDAGSDALVEWNHRLSDLLASMESAAEAIQAASAQDVTTARATIDASVKPQLDALIQREVKVIVLAPTWRKVSDERLVLTIKSFLESIRSSYTVLMNGVAAPQTGAFQITINEDATLSDNRAQCMELVFSFAKDKNDEGICLSAASFYCGHQMDLTCVQYQLSAANQRGLGCATADTSGDSVEAKWMGDIGTCRSQTLVLKSENDPQNTIRQSCILAIDLFASGNADSGRCLQVANRICEEQTNLTCLNNLIATASENGEGCVKTTNNGNGSVTANATWLGYVDSCN